jgi:hypothetical protein
MAWMTSLPVSKDNVAEIVACSRARWKIRWKMENERFNVLKNHGYELGHNFGQPEVSRDDASDPQSARLRLAHRARTSRTALAGAPRSGGQPNQFLRPRSEICRPLG